MGYTTEFKGKLTFDRELTVSELRRLEDMADMDFSDAEWDKYSQKPDSYLQWRPTRDGTGLEWDGGEKFYNYVEWLEWLMENFFTPEGIKVNGEILWQGEEFDDLGKITVTDNVVKSKEIKLEGIVECPNCGERFKPNE